MKWSGDVDLNDGSVQKQYDAYQNRLKKVGSIGLEDGISVTDQLEDLLQNLTKDLDFVYSGDLCLFYTHYV